MTVYDFDHYIERRNTNSLKYDFAVERGYPKDVLPLWVADMDFPTAQPVLDALHSMTNHGIFGYSDVKDDYALTVAHWFETYFDWKPDPEWLIKTPGVVFALAMAIRALTQPGDSILIQTPVYYPFYSIIRDNNRRLVENELRYLEGHYEIDFDDLEEKIKTYKVKLILLCSPHNPVGRVWTREELQRLGRLCIRYDVFVASDEIHCDFAFPGHPHTVFTCACPELEAQSIICTSPSKTFNLAGLQVSNIWVPNSSLRQCIQKEIDRCGYSQLNAFGLTATHAAYKNGRDWLDQCRAYLWDNLIFLRDFLSKRLPDIRLVEPEGTYFAWLDCSGLGLDYQELNELIINKAKLWLDAGHIFGQKSADFQRIVLACPRSTLTQALTQLEGALVSLLPGSP